MLPLRNVGGDPSDDYFCDGIVEDITLSLSGLRELMVISRGSALAYRGREADPREVGQTLGVRYVLMGTLRRWKGSVRISVELCDAETGATLWAERTDAEADELFDIQDRVVTRIVCGIAPNVRAAELEAALRRRPESLAAYDCTLRALHLMNTLDATRFGEARALLSKAIAEDPRFAMPVAWSARWHSIYVGQGWSPNPQEDSSKAIELAAAAIDLDAHNALGLATYAHLKSYLFHDYETSLFYFERALRVCPNHSLAWALSSATYSYIGKWDQAISHAEYALKLSPLDSSAFYYYNYLALAYYTKGEYGEAVKWARLSVAQNPGYTATLRIFAAALVGLGDTKEAQSCADQLLCREPTFRIGEYQCTRLPFQPANLIERYVEHLREAGLPT